tara:strand:- start:701 stop:934 length:234 start_codon:yes stop_codon:yes gene_type:complete
MREIARGGAVSCPPGENLHGGHIATKSICVISFLMAMKPSTQESMMLNNLSDAAIDTAMVVVAATILVISAMCAIAA